MYDKGILSEKVAEDIRKMIQDKNYQPGDKLPNELDLSDLINVSRSTIREAIKILVSTNVLEVKRGRGTFVSQNPGVVKDPLGVVFMEEDNLLLHFFEVRLIIEPQMIELAVQRANEEDLNTIQSAYEEVKRLIESGENHTSADILFHNAIAKATKNPIMERVLPIINNGIEGGYSKTKDNPEASHIVLKQHEAIMTALQSRNAQEASKAMKRHIRYGYERCQKDN